MADTLGLANKRRASKFTSPKKVDMTNSDTVWNDFIAQQRQPVVSVPVAKSIMAQPTKKVVKQSSAKQPTTTSTLKAPPPLEAAADPMTAVGATGTAMSPHTSSVENPVEFNTSGTLPSLGLIGPHTSYVPTQGLQSPNSFQKGINALTGSTLGYNVGLGENNTVGYVGANGEQMYTGDLSNNPEALAYFQQNPNALDSTSLIGSTIDNSGSMFSGLSGILQNKDLMTGISGLASAAGTGFDIYDKMWGNSAKTAEAQQNLLNQQARQNDQRMRDYKNFRQGLASSGLSAAYNG